MYSSQFEPEFENGHCICEECQKKLPYVDSEFLKQISAAGFEWEYKKHSFTYCRSDTAIVSYCPSFYLPEFDAFVMPINTEMIDTDEFLPVLITAVRSSGVELCVVEVVDFGKFIARLNEVKAEALSQLEEEKCSIDENVLN